jgi:hypothetical protein
VGVEIGIAGAAEGAVGLLVGEEEEDVHDIENLSSFAKAMEDK